MRTHPIFSFFNRCHHFSMVKCTLRIIFILIPTLSAWCLWAIILTGRQHWEMFNLTLNWNIDWNHTWHYLAQTTQINIRIRIILKRCTRIVNTHFHTWHRWFCCWAQYFSLYRAPSHKRHNHSNRDNFHLASNDTRECFRHAFFKSWSLCHWSITLSIFAWEHRHQNWRNRGCGNQNSHHSKHAKICIRLIERDIHKWQSKETHHVCHNRQCCRNNRNSNRFFSCCEWIDAFITM